MNSSGNTEQSAVSHDRRFIYIVDDEGLLLEHARAALEPAGYRLKLFQDPRIALREFAGENPRPALLLTDYAMQHLTGMELIERCKQLAPELKALLVSGTAGTEVLGESNAKIEHFMPKPYAADALLRVVRGLLE